MGNMLVKLTCYIEKGCGLILASFMREGRWGKRPDFLAGGSLGNFHSYLILFSSTIFKNDCNELVYDSFSEALHYATLRWKTAKLKIKTLVFLKLVSWRHL